MIQITEQHLSDVRAIAYKNYGKMSHVDDLIQVGHMRLVECAQSFDETKGVPFRAYFLRRVRFAMQDYLRDQKWGPRRKDANVMVQWPTHEGEDWEPQSYDKQGRVDDRIDVRDAVERLSGVQRDIMRLRIAGLEYPDIARALRYQLRNVYYHSTQARRNLRSLMA